MAAFVLLSFVFLAGAAVAADGHVITDQLGRTVRIPPKVERVVCLQHHTLNIILEEMAALVLEEIIIMPPSPSKIGRASCRERV